MKHVAYFLTAVALSFIGVFTGILQLLWNLSFEESIFKEFKVYSCSAPFSPYFEIPEADKNKSAQTYKFKSIFHYIWNIT